MSVVESKGVEKNDETNYYIWTFSTWPIIKIFLRIWTYQTWTFEKQWESRSALHIPKTLVTTPGAHYNDDSRLIIHVFI